MEAGVQRLEIGGDVGGSGDGAAALPASLFQVLLIFNVLMSWFVAMFIVLGKINATKLNNFNDYGAYSSKLQLFSRRPVP